MKTNKFVDLFHNPTITVSEFITALLSRMNKKGVSYIEEEDLAIKLYEYYKNPKYKELFFDFAESRQPFKKMVDIEEAMWREKYLGGCIWWLDNQKRLNLKYGQDFNNDSMENDIPRELLAMIDEISDDFAIRFRTEVSSKHRLTVYGLDKDITHRIVTGKVGVYRKNYEWRLLTDGEIESLEEIPYSKDFTIDDPERYWSAMGIEEYTAKRIKTTGASFEIMQGIINDTLTSVNIYTNIRNNVKLTQISELAQTIDSIDEDKKPYVRQVKL